MRVNTSRLKLEFRRSRASLLLYALFLVCGLVAVYIPLKNITFQAPWKHYNTVRVHFADAKGVNGNYEEVRIAGVKVGMVKSMKVQGREAVLTLSIDKKYGKLYRNARVELRPQTPLQDMYVNIDSRGTPAAGVAQDITSDRTSSPVDVSRILDTFDQDTRLRMHEMLTELGRGLDAAGGENLRQAFVQLVPFLKAADGVTQQMSVRRERVRRLVHNFGALSAVLAKRDNQLTSLVRNGEGTLRQLAGNDGPFADTIQQIPPALHVLRSSLASLSSVEDTLDPTLTRLMPAARKLESGLSGLESFAHEASPALADLREPVTRLRPVAGDLSETASALTGSAAVLEPQAPRLDRMTAMIPPCLKSIAAFFHRTISMTKFGDAWQVTPRADAVINLNTSDNLMAEPTYRKLAPCAVTSKAATEGPTR